MSGSPKERHWLTRKDWWQLGSDKWRRLPWSFKGRLGYCSKCVDKTPTNCACLRGAALRCKVSKCKIRTGVVVKVILRSLLALIVFVSASSIAVAEMYEAIENVSVHDFPDRSATQTGVIKKGQTVSIKQRVGAWVRVGDYEGDEGGRRASWSRRGAFKSVAALERERAEKAEEEERKRLAEESRRRNAENLARQAVEDALAIKAFNERSRTAYSDASEARQRAISAMLEKTRDSLKDPVSAMFRKIHAPDDRDDVVCGELNAKNSHGGYTGYARFIYANGIVFIDSDDRDIDKNWILIC